MPSTALFPLRRRVLVTCSAARQFRFRRRERSMCAGGHQRGNDNQEDTFPLTCRSRSRVACSLTFPPTAIRFPPSLPPSLLLAPTPSSPFHSPLRSALGISSCSLTAPSCRRFCLPEQVQRLLIARCYPMADLSPIPPRPPAGDETRAPVRNAHTAPGADALGPRGWTSGPDHHRRTHARAQRPVKAGSRASCQSSLDVVRTARAQGREGNARQHRHGGGRRRTRVPGRLAGHGGRWCTAKLPDYPRPRLPERTQILEGGSGRKRPHNRAPKIRRVVPECLHSGFLAITRQ